MEASVLGHVEGGLAAPQQVTAEDLLRAQFYSLLARLLAQPPDAATLADLARMDGLEPTALGSALADLGRAAHQHDVDGLEDEFHALFIGLGRGELLPFACHYLTGFLQDAPLAVLRADMATLGIAAAEHRAEPEDHIASLCEMMAGLIRGHYAAPTCLTVQRAFFDAHLRPWARRFFADLEQAGAARFYRSVGSVGRIFFDIESEAFALADQGASQ